MSTTTATASIPQRTAEMLPPVPVMRRACARKDPRFEGIFFFGVPSTGVFCRPTCPSIARWEKVRFYASPAEARQAGFRPCRRCRPEQPLAGEPPWMERLTQLRLRTVGLRVRNSQLQVAGLDPAMVRRYFQRSYGLSFQQYDRLTRMGRAAEQLAKGCTPEQIAIDHGYESASGVRAALIQWRGPARLGQTGDWVRLEWVNSPLGRMVAGATERGICLLEFLDVDGWSRIARRLRQTTGLPCAPGSVPCLIQLKEQLSAYFAGDRARFDLPLDLRGTPFQRRVWGKLLEIEPGTCWSYAELAAAVGARAAPRAVGRANGANPVAIVVPCHRVIRGGGQLAGYSGGVWRKYRLLQLEQTALR